MAVSIIDGSATTCGSGGGGVAPSLGAAPANARYWVGAAHAELSAEHNLGALATGIVINTTGTPSVVAHGTNGHVLTMVAGAPAWAVASGGVTDHGALTGLADDDHPQYVRVLTAGTGLAGGGSGGSLTLNLANTAVSPASYTYASITVDAQGRLTAASSGTTPVLPTRQILTTAGHLTGGGDLSADRTLALASVGPGAGTIGGGGNVVTSVTLDAQGRVTAATAGVGGSGGYATIERPNGTPLTQRAIMSFTTEFTVADNVDTTDISLATNGVAFSKIAQLAGLSVLGVTGGSTANMAAITGTADQVLRVNSAGTALAFGTVATAGIADDAVTYAKLQDSSAGGSVLGRASSAGGQYGEISTSTDGHVLRRSSGTLGFGTLAAGAFAGTQTNGFVLTLSAGVPTWLAASAGITGSGTANQVTYWSSSSAVTGASGFTYDPSTVFLLVENTGSGNAGSIRTSNTNSGALMTLSSQGGGVGGSFGGITDQSTNMIACTGTMKVGPTGGFPIHLITNNLQRLSILSGGTLQIFSTTAPGSNPSGSGYLYVESGSLKYRDPSGVITTIA